jgi:tetratricopeptide (TPR) repeat protein
MKTEATPRTSSEHFLIGRHYLAEEDMDRALRAFEKAYKGDRENPQYMSYYGMCKALRGGEVGLGLKLCTSAIKKEFRRAEYYLNLGRVYLAIGNRKGAAKVFEKGLRFEPMKEDLRSALRELGFRKHPVIPALDRSNPLNKLLGLFFRRSMPAFLQRKKAR